MFTKLLRRNLIAVLIPILIIEVLIILMVFQLNVLEEYSCQRINSLEGVDLLYEEGVQNISFLCEEVPEYCGYDEVKEDGEIVGGYYYIKDGDNIRLLVLTTKTYLNLTSGGSYDVYGKLVRDDMKIEHIEDDLDDELAKKIGQSSDAFKGYIKPIIINEVEYPATKIAIIEHSAAVISVVILLTVLYSIVAFACPWIIMGFDYKPAASKRVDAIDILDEEMDERLENENGNVFTTENFIICAYLSHIKVIKREFDDDEEDEIIEEDDDIILEEVETIVPKDQMDPTNQKGSESEKASKESKDSKGLSFLEALYGTKDPENPKDTKNLKDTKESKGLKNPKNPKSKKDSKKK